MFVTCQKTARNPAPGPAGRLAAFTLVELLVVIAILAILLSILMPTLQYATKRAATAGCQANLREMGSAFVGFCNEENQLSPPKGTPVGAYNDLSSSDYSPPYYSWMEFLSRYVGTPYADEVRDARWRPLNSWRATSANIAGSAIHQWFPASKFTNRKGTIFACPGAEWREGLSETQVRWVDYNVISDGLPSWKPQVATQVRRGRYWMQVSSPSDKILFMDAGGPVASGNPSNDRWYGPGSYAQAEVTANVANVMGFYSYGHWLSDRHSDGSNALYLDGSVRLIPNIMLPNDDFYGYWWHRNAPFAWADHDSGMLY